MTEQKPLVVTTRAELNAASGRLLQQAAPRNGAGTPDVETVGSVGSAGIAGSSSGGPSLGLVPTMGALHEGHEALARTARKENDVVVATIFVNPLQFGENADLERYPRTFDDDVELLGRCGVDIVFAPPVEEVYPRGMPMVRISAGELGEKYEGAFRPGHFDGALTVVAKLLHYGMPARTAAYRAYFGQKDAQQLTLVRRMAADLNFDVDIIAVPTVRAADGLALSSRNRFLNQDERAAALTLFGALRTLAERADAHEPLELDEVVDLVAAHPLVELDYLDVVDPVTLEPLGENCRHTPFTGTALALIAARVGPVRLIDNMVLGTPASTS
ncbi:MAG TPA: pantoate--beta-alanine ligase [Arthrobacter sp.]|nr:pantoate--beta-alanine ligase [Arthrobacter sp.]